MPLVSRQSSKRAAPKVPNPPAQANGSPATTALTSIQVTHATKQVFCTLMFDEASPSQSAGVAWKDFLAAMTDVGFSAQHKKGSSWVFVPPAGVAAGGSISIHSPHPESAVHFYECRKIGRRLRERYGWTLTTFVERTRAERRASVATQ